MPDPFEILGLTQGASMLKVEQAYKYLKDLYSNDSLATYSLLDTEQRRNLLDSIDQAYGEILARNKSTEGAVPVIEEPDFEDMEMPDRKTNPGAYLRWCRQRAGLSLKDLSKKIMVSSTRLEDIEMERFDKLPAHVFVRGYIAEYIRCFNIGESKELIENYVKLMSAK